MNELDWTRHDSAHNAMHLLASAVSHLTPKMESFA